MSANTKYLPVTWNQYHRLTRTLASQILQSGFRFDRVIGISRCGLTLGHVLSDFLQLPVSIIGFESYTGIQKQGRIRLTQKLGVLIKGERILLVDGIADSGKTLIAAADYLSRYLPRTIVTATLFLKRHSVVTPKFYVKKTERWILFPYENTEWTIAFISQMEEKHRSDEYIQKLLFGLGFTKEQLSFVQRFYFSSGSDR